MSSMDPFGMQMNDKPSYKWQRVLLKVSGEALAGNQSRNIDPKTAFRISEVAEPYMLRRAVRHLEKRRVVIFAAGTADAEVVLKAMNADGVYDGDPRHNASAFLHDTLTYHEVTSKDFSGMDMTAITLCQENNIPVGQVSKLKRIGVNSPKFPSLNAIVVFNLNKPGNILKAIKGRVSAH
ncbi:hypothetical protein V6N11_043462 [Hibiscus sabdariffa]|uniref:UMP kinase n=1 Tax=Hibiscus sabdariffa TaxID=183260 RepID=A0ABR2RCK1_9ROSI